MVNNKPPYDDSGCFHSLDCVTLIIDGERSRIILPVPRSRWDEVLAQRELFSIEPSDIQPPPDQPQE